MRELPFCWFLTKAGQWKVAVGWCYAPPIRAVIGQKKINACFNISDRIFSTPTTANMA
jgi:hypothetical protein